MSRILVAATGGAGGDLQPLIAAERALARRGHQTAFIGDAGVQASLEGGGVQIEVLPPELDLGPRLMRAVQDALASSDGDPVKAGPAIQEGLAAWAGEMAVPLRAAIAWQSPDAIITSLFGAEVIHLARPACPWAVINSTFYIGPSPPRPVEQDFGPRVLPLVSRFAELLELPDLVLHATDPVFDLSFDAMPPRHHHVGPLGIWEPPSAPPPFLGEPGDPWVLVSISSQRQDDLPIVQTALAALADRPVRVLATVGPGHALGELSDVPPNARVEATVPHSAVLERALLLVSHAGHGSVMKALWHGVPMVLVPWGRDQPGVAARAHALGVAQVVPCDVSPSALTDAVDHVLANDVMRRTAVEHSNRLRPTDPPAAAATLLESLLV